MKKILSVLIATAILICGLAIGSVGAYDEPQYALVPQITVGITPAQTKQNRLLIVNTKDTGEVQQSIGTLSQVYGNGETEMDKIDFDGEEHALIDPTSAIRNIWSPNVSKSLSRNKSFSTVRMSYTVGSQRSFYLGTEEDLNYFHRKTCVVLATSQYATVWAVQGDTTVTQTRAQQLASEFDRTYPMMLDAFGSSASIDVDNDGKIALVCYDIQGDNATNPESFIGGYFYGGDLMSDLNGADMLNIDTYLMQLNQMPGIYDIMVHEFQHLINFAWYVETETEMPVYLNEAYSEAAGHLIYGYASKNSRVSTFNYSTDIKNGLSLVEWEGTLDNYALAYLFGQYIRTQFGNSTIYKQVVSTPAVTKSYLQLIADKLGVSVPDLLFNFRAALEIKAKTGPYGFKGEVFMDSVTTKACTSSSVTSLAPSTAIYKDIYTTSVQLPTNAGPDVRFLFISYTKDPFIESVSYNPATSAASVSVKNIGSTGGTLYVTGYKDENGGRKMTGVYLIPATAGQTEINWQNSFPAGTGYVKTIFLQNTTLKPLSEGKAA